MVISSLVLAAACAAIPQQWSCYRSFNKEFPTMRRFADAGIVTRCFTLGNTVNSAGNPYCQYPVVWTGKDKYDWATIDREFQEMVDASPDVRFVVLLDLNTPPWLQRRLRIDSFSLISLAATDPDWMKFTLPWLKAFVSHAEEKWGSRTVGYLLGAGNCTEWTELNYAGNRPRVYSSEFQDAAWRAWCAARGTDRGPSVPRGESLSSAAFRNAVYDPATEGEKIDYWKFRNESVADALLAFAHAAKALAPGKEIGAFFGYSILCNPSMFLSWNHMAYERVFDSPDIDFIAAPANYRERACGGGTGPLVPIVSLSRRGKRYMHEIDFWPHDEHPDGQVFTASYFKTLEDDIAGNMREAAFTYVTHSSLWWFDQWGRFYNSPALFDSIARSERIRRELADDRSPSAADVLFVVDPESAYHFNETAPVLRGYPWRIRDELAKTGFAHDTCTFSDLAHIDLARYRVVFLTDQVVVTPERRKFLNDSLLRDGRTLVWFFAPGICDGKTLDENRVRELTGVPFGTKGAKDFGAWRSVLYPDYASFDAAEFARLLGEAGAHAWCDHPSVVHANARIFSVHLKDGGVRKVRLPRRAARVKELFSGRIVAEDADAFDYAFESPDTRIFEMVF